MRRWLLIGLFVLVSGLLFGFQRGSQASDSISLVGGGYRLERVTVGRTTAIPGAHQKLVVVKYRLSGDVTKTISLSELASGVQVLDARGRAYPQVKGLPVAILRTVEQDPKTFETSDKVSLRGNPVFMSTFLIPSTTVIEKVSFGTGRTAQTLEAGRAIGGLDYYVDSGVTPLETISASRGEWYVSGGLDIRFDGYTTKTGTLGEIEGAEEGEVFIIGSFSVRNATGVATSLFAPGKEELPFKLETGSGESGEQEAMNETVLHPEMEAGLDDFSIAPGAEKKFRVFWKVSRTSIPFAFSVVEKSAGVFTRPITWPAKGRGTTSPRKNTEKPITPTEPTEPKQEELDLENLNVKGLRVSSSQFSKKFPDFSKTIQLAKIPSFDRPIPDLNKFYLDVDPIVVGPVLETKVYPLSEYRNKPKASKVIVETDGETKITCALQILKNGQFVNGSSGKKISLNCPKDCTYRLVFAIPNSTTPGTYNGRFLVDDGSKRAINVTYIVVAKSGGVTITPAFSTVPIIEAGSEKSLPFNVSLQGNTASAIKITLQSGVKGLTMSSSALYLKPGEKKTVNLTFAADFTAEPKQVTGDEVRIAATAVELKTQAVTGFRVLIDPVYGIFEYHGTIGNVTYNVNLLFKPSGDWVWTAAGSTSSKISGDALLTCMCLSLPDNGFRHYIQVALPLGAKLEKMPSAMTYIASGNDPWIRDNYGAIFDAGFSAKIARFDIGVFSFTNNNPFDPMDAAPVKYGKWMAAQRCKYSLQSSAIKVLK